MNKDQLQFIKERRSTRSFKEIPLDKSTINSIIQVGKFAPSAKNSQPWQFIVITNKETIQELSLQVKYEIKKILRRRILYQFFNSDLRKKETLQSLYGLTMAKKDVIFHEAPVVVFIVTKKGVFNDESCACCAENMMLAAHSLEIGSCWIGFAHFLGLNKKVLEKIGVPKNMHIAAALIFGHPTETNKKIPIRKPMADVINWIE
jgi:nitroreductase